MKLSPVIFKPSHTALKTQKATDESLLVVFDNCLPNDLFNRLGNIFSPSGRFFVKHDYFNSGGDSFYSYNTPLPQYSASASASSSSKSENIIQEIGIFILPQLQQAFPQKNFHQKGISIEWWCHARQGGQGHQLHFDLNEQALFEAQQEARMNDYDSPVKLPTHLHPLVSCILYIDAGDSAAGSTLVTDQILTPESRATRGWLVEPKDNRLMAFDGGLLHGVIPKLPTKQSKHRITLMLGFWSPGIVLSDAPSLPLPISMGATTQHERCLRPNMRMPTPRPNKSNDGNTDSDYVNRQNKKRKQGKSEGRKNGLSGSCWINDFRPSDDSNHTQTENQTKHPRNNDYDDGVKCNNTKKNESRNKSGSKSNARKKRIEGVMYVEPVWVEVKGQRQSCRHDQEENVARDKDQSDKAVTFMTLADLQALQAQQAQQAQQEDIASSYNTGSDEDEEDMGDEIIFPGRFFLNRDPSDIYKEIVFV